MVDKRNADAWMIAALTRAKNMPKLQDLKAGESKPESRQDMVNRMRAYFSMHNARVAAKVKKNG